MSVRPPWAESTENSAPYFLVPAPEATTRLAAYAAPAMPDKPKTMAIR